MFCAIIQSICSLQFHCATRLRHFRLVICVKKNAVILGVNDNCNLCSFAGVLPMSALVCLYVHLCFVMPACKHLWYFSVHSFEPEPLFGMWVYYLECKVALLFFCGSHKSFATIRGEIMKALIAAVSQEGKHGLSMYGRACIVHTVHLHCTMYRKIAFGRGNCSFEVNRS